MDNKNRFIKYRGGIMPKLPKDNKLAGKDKKPQDARHSDPYEDLLDGPLGGG